MEEKKPRPQDKWNEKAGYISKSYRLYKSLADEYAEACKKAGVTQSGQLKIMMQEFIDKVNKKTTLK